MHIYRNECFLISNRFFSLAIYWFKSTLLLHHHRHFFLMALEIEPKVLHLLCKSSLLSCVLRPYFISFLHIVKFLK